ncbi:MAG: hypothetical protein ACREQ2_04730 [Candidatus Binatia bacterium]
MKSGKKFGVGMHVKIVPQHWLRGGEIAEILRFEQRGQNNWLVKFDRPFAGGGIEGDKLWLSQHEFAEVLDEDDMGPVASASRPEKPAGLITKRSNGSSRHGVESQESQNGSA